MPYIRGIKDFSQSDEIINEQNISNMIEVTWDVERIGQFKDYYLTNQKINEFLASNQKIKETTFENFFHKVLFGDLSDPLPGYTKETKNRTAIPISAQSCKVTMTKQGARILSRENDLQLINCKEESLNLENEGKLKKVVVKLGEPGYDAIVAYDTGKGLQNAWNLDKKTAEEASYLFKKSNTGVGNEHIICALSSDKSNEERATLGSYADLYNESDYYFAAATFEGIKPLITQLQVSANNLDIMCPLFVVCNGKEFFLNETEIAKSKGIDNQTSDFDTYIKLLDEIELMYSDKKGTVAKKN